MTQDQKAVSNIEERDVAVKQSPCRRNGQHKNLIN